jgi:two-component system sensor histidine kinase KdpD
VLEAGIDVFSTVNVQHLESLNDQVAELTGVRVRETLPDAVLAAADEVVIVDLTPQALIDRLRAGKVYPPERVPAALQNFFRAENLAALREVALRQVAEGVEAQRLPRDAVQGREDRLATTAAPQAVSERLLALVTPDPRSHKIVRRAWRSARRLGGDLDLLWVSGRDQSTDPGHRDQVEALRRLASVLGAHLLIEPDDDIVGAVARVARERGTTYVLMGVPRHRGPLQRLVRPGLVDQILRELPGVDVRVVADRSRRKKGST